MEQTQTKKNSGDVARTHEKASSQPSAVALTPEKQTLTEEEKQFLQLCYEGKADISQFMSLLEKGVRLNIHNKDGWHPIWLVSEQGRTDLVDLFLQRGADVDLPSANKFGSTALIISCQNGYLETAKLLLQRGASINYQRKDGVTALYFACKNIHVAVVQLLLKSGAQVNKGSDPPLYTASLEGRLNIVQILLDHGADVNQPNDTEKRSSPLIAACGHNHPQVSQLLINHNADVNYQDSNGDTPIHFAAGSGHLEVVKLLVQSHANLNVKDNNYGNTPLHWGSKKGNPKVVKILVQSQANLNVKNKLGGNTPLHLAVGNGHSEVVKELLLSQAKLDIKNNAGKTPLQVAEEKKYSEIVSLLKTGVPAPGEGEREGESERSSETEGDQVPSGHILTKLEHQVLANLLAAYSDEKLKEIQLSIQEKQDVGQISREEVERSLRQSGLVSVADGLKESIDKGVENFKHYEAYKQALEGGLELTLRYLKFLFFGPPRSGKSTTRRRLIREIVNLHQLGGPSISTGVAETNDVIIKKLTCEPAAIAGSQWQSMKRSNEGVRLDIYSEENFSYLARLFYRLIYRNAAPATSSDLVQVQNNGDRLASEDGETQATTGSGSESVQVQNSDHATKDNKVHDVSNIPIAPAPTTDQKAESTELMDEDAEIDLTDSEEIEIKDAFKKLTTILQSDSPEDLKQLLEELTMINMTDVGGQPAFLDMLPALTIGPALYLLFFRLDQDLDKHYPVRFHPAESKEDIVLESSYCIKEVLHQCLASIACFSCHQSAASALKVQVASSGALLFGTYKDKVNDHNKISQIECKLEKDFEESKLHEEGLLLKSSRGKMVITIDNMFGTDESEMSDVRSDIEGIIKSYFPATPIPVSWLMFRIVLHLLNKPVVSLSQCENIAMRLSMPTPVQEALWFFHHNVGSLMYYSDIPSMEDIVICDPQVIFDSISKLIIDKFKCSNRALKPREVKDFHEKGQFSLSHIRDKTECQHTSHLKLNQLMDLLKHLNILVEVKQHEDKPKFIMPAVMKYASENELVPPSNSQASPLVIHFESGFVPFGVFCAGMALLIARQDSMSLKWELCDDQVRKNKVKFVVDEAFFATLISRPQYIMVYVEQCPNTLCESKLEEICTTVRQTIVETLETVISKMKYKAYESLHVSSKQPFELAFACCRADSHSDHLMIVAKDKRGRHAKCLKDKVASYLKDVHLIWFKTQDEGSLSNSESSSSLDAVKCGVCRDIQIDPCTLACGHAFCLLCLARLWKDNEKFCPVCKETWEVFPAISYDFRTTIESSYGQQVAQLREQYTQEDKELIKEVLGAKSATSSSQESESPALPQKIMIKEDLEETIIHDSLPPWTFPKDLTNEQLVVMLTNHPILMGADYHHDIQRLKEAKLGGKKLLNLDKESLEQFGLSTEFQTPLMKFIKDLKQYQHTLKSKIQPKSLTSEAATSDEHAVTEISSEQPTETTVKTKTEETDASHFISAQPPELDEWKLPGVDECGETSVVISSSQGQLVEWNGLKMHIHEGSLPEGIDQCTIHIKASLAGVYEIPENSSLVSAVFWLRCEPQCTFTKPITVEIQHCSTKQDLSRLKIIRAYCNQKQLPYKFKPLGGRFNAEASYGVIEVNSFSGVGVIEENPDSERMYYSQLFYRSFYSHQQTHDIHIAFTWNTEPHINYVAEKYPKEQGFHAGCYQVVELDGDVIKVCLDRAQWTKVMDGQWEIQPAKSTVTKAELNVFKIGRGIPNCVLEARPLCEQFPQLLLDITLSGIKPPYNELTLSYMPSKKDPTGDATVQPQLDGCPPPLVFSVDLSYEQLAVWLTNHPKLVGGYQQDINKLKDARVNGYAFLSLDVSALRQLGVSLGFRVTLMNIIENLKRSQQRHNRETLSSQQQLLVDSADTSTTQHQRTSSATNKQIKPGYAEYDVLIHHTADLQITVRTDLIGLGAQLVSAQIITPDQYEKIRNIHQSVDERAADLVGYVQIKVRQDPQYYNAFTDALRRDLSQYAGILTKLEDSFNNHPLTMAMGQQSSIQQDPTSDAVQQLQASSTVQPQLAVQPQPLVFSEDMNYEQLAVWLTNHPQFVGADHQEDISKLKGARINGFALLTLSESRLECLGMSMGFHVTLMSIVEDLKSSQPSPVSERLPSQQQQSPASSAALPTTRNQPMSSAADTTDKQTKFDELPTLDELLILKYMDKGEKKKLRIISEASHKWKNIANLICGDINVTTVLEQKYHGDPEECLKQTFINYFISKKPQRYTQDWNGLIELLDDVDLETLAENVKQALPYVCT